jgi:hypothetical protein
MTLMAPDWDNAYASKPHNFRHFKTLAKIAQLPSSECAPGRIHPSGVARMISTPSDVAMFSRFPEADQKAILLQATDAEFERYVTHVEKKLRGPMRRTPASGRRRLLLHPEWHLLLPPERRPPSMIVAKLIPHNFQTCGGMDR